LSRFRTELTQKQAFDCLLKKINRQHVTPQVIIHHGAGIIDATLTDTPHCPKDSTTYEIVEDRREDDRSDPEQEKEASQMKLVKQTQPGVDSEVRYLKKGKKFH
jgi:IS5 family transposase